MIKVRPNYHSRKGIASFKTAREAVQYLEEYTGGTSSGRTYDEKLEEWIWIGKAKIV
jgi:hypothetical protein